MDSGRLERDPTPVVCRRLGAESRTGCLRLLGEDPADEVRIYLWEGRIYTASAPEGRARLGDRLVGGGHLSADALREALQLQQERPRTLRLGDLLVQEGMLSREVLRDVLRDQICDSLAVGLSRRTGEWRFVDGEQVPEDVPLGLSMEDALLEAARRLDELEVIRAQLGSFDAVVDFRAGSMEVRLSLRADEWEMLTHIDGYTTVTEVAERSGYSQLEAARIIYGLLSAGVLRVVDGGSASDPVAGAQPEPSSTWPAAPPTAPAPPAGEGAWPTAPAPAVTAHDDLLSELKLLGGQQDHHPAPPQAPPAPTPGQPSAGGAAPAADPTPASPAAAPQPAPPHAPPPREDPEPHGDEDAGRRTGGVFGRFRRR